MLKAKILLVTVIYFWLHSVFGQQFEYLGGDDIAVIESGTRLTDPFSGGFNGVQINELDIDGDGEKEWIIFDRSNNKAHIGYQENGSMKIDHEKSEILPQEIDNWLIFADFDNDGRPDIFTDTSFGVQAIRNREESWEILDDNLKADSRGNLVNIVVSGSDYPAIGDFDEDGDVDLMVFDFVAGDRIVFYKNISVENNLSDPLVFEKSDLFWGEIEECFCNDFIFSEDGCNPGRSEAIEHAASKSITFYNDDLLIGIEGCPELAYLPNQGDFEDEKFDSFATDFFSKTNFGDYAVTTYGDVNEDGTRDFIVSSNLRSDSFIQDFSRSINVFSGKDNSLITENFLQDQAIDVGEQSYPTLHDWDNDGDLDLFVGNKGRLIGDDYYATISYYENTGNFRNPEFTLRTEDFSGLSQFDFIRINPSFHDINQDGLADLVFSAGKKDLNRGDVYIAFQNADQTLQQPQSWDFRYSRFDLPVIRDINADGRLDILLCQNFGRISTFLNFGTNLEPDFNEQENLFLDIDSDGRRINPSLAFANVDDDNDIEILKSDSRGILEIYQPESTDPTSENFYNNLTGQVSRFDLGYNNPMVFGDLYGSNELYGIIGDIRGGLKVIRLRSTEQQELFTDIIAYPNPVIDRTEILLYTEQTQEVTIFDSAGRKVMHSFTLAANEEQLLDVAALNSGVYFLRGVNNTFRLVIR
ncbi:MAG: FG-GAP-like repeat-containing protein [Cyclobacteriaceae bacterium]